MLPLIPFQRSTDQLDVTLRYRLTGSDARRAIGVHISDWGLIHGFASQVDPPEGWSPDRRPGALPDWLVRFRGQHHSRPGAVHCRGSAESYPAAPGARPGVT